MIDIDINKLKRMTPAEMYQLSAGIREELINVTLKNGGHLASNLGVVELTLALHYVFDSPRDKIVFDVGHQTYIHKILTGRAQSFESIRTKDGLSGFSNRLESEHDLFTTGHSSASISAALGLARARDLKGENYNVVAVIGDGALGGGMALEAINDLGYKKSRLIIVLNQNDMSIAQNVGALSEHLTMLRTTRPYADFKKGLTRFLNSVPLIGKPLYKLLERIKNSIRYMIMGDTLFERLGIKYLGPINGNDIPALIKILERTKQEDGPVLVHVATKKGKGYPPAENNPEKYHGVSPSGGCAEKSESFSLAMGEELIRLARQNDKICAVTAGMPLGTGLQHFAALYPSRFYDVGICEQHALALGAGLAAGGMRPFVAVYSTFLQRGLDQLFHDICLQNLPVIILEDRSGLTGEDGEAHQGIYDLGFLRSMPSLTIMAPRDIPTLKYMMELALKSSAPCVIRYPKGCSLKIASGQPLMPYKWQTVRKSGGRIILLAFGAMLNQALKASELLEAQGIEADVADACFIKPIDTQFLTECQAHSLLFIIEDNVCPGGLFEGVSGYMESEKKDVRVIGMNLSDAIVPHASINQQREMFCLTAEDIAARVISELKD